MKTFKKYVDERQMSTPQKVQQMNFYWKDLDHLASDEMKKKKMNRAAPVARCTLRNIRNHFAWRCLLVILGIFSTKKDIFY